MERSCQEKDHCISEDNGRSRRGESAARKRQECGDWTIDRIEYKVNEREEYHAQRLMRKYND